jgi:hypothetical protein
MLLLSKPGCQYVSAFDKPRLSASSKLELEAAENTKTRIMRKVVGRRQSPYKIKAKNLEHIVDAGTDLGIIAAIQVPES